MYTTGPAAFKTFVQRYGISAAIVIYYGIAEFDFGHVTHLPSVLDVLVVMLTGQCLFGFYQMLVMPWGRRRIDAVVDYFVRRWEERRRYAPGTPPRQHDAFDFYEAQMRYEQRDGDPLDGTGDGPDARE
ncbi:hypothetical protein [Nocardia sp. No.11]|uniref:hypothetical protein n=1 Tax=Nocardia sp. No.11 TaxID=3128861 RepID=UPI00319DB638